MNTAQAIVREERREQPGRLPANLEPANTPDFSSPLRDRLQYTCAGVFLTCIAVWASQSRFIAPDEGFYLYAARLIQEGLVPYRDFFFPQPPLAAYTFAALFELFGRSWFVARVVSALCTIAACGVLARTTAAVYGKRVALVSLVVLGLCIPVQVWFPIAKNTAIASLFLALALDAYLRRSRVGWASFWFGCCALTRLPFAAAALVLLVPLGVGRRDYLRQLGYIALGGIIPLAVAVVFTILDPFNFWEGTVGYHLYREQFPDSYLMKHRRMVFKSVFGIGRLTGAGGFQILLLSVSALASTWLLRRRDRRVFILPSIAGLLAAAHMIPTPTYVQYFSVVAFLLVPPAVAGWYAVGERLRTTGMARSQRWESLSVASVLVCFGLLGLGEWSDFTRTGNKVIGVGRHSAESWRLETISKVSAEIDRRNPDGKPVFSSWPGYLVESQSSVVRGTENQFAQTWVRNAALPPEEQDRRNIVSYDRALEALARGEVGLAVVYSDPTKEPELATRVEAAGGQRVTQIEGISLFKK